MRAHRAASLLLSFFVVVALTASCAGGPTGSATASPTGQPASPPPAVLTLDVLPAQSTGFTLPGEKFVFLVSVGGPAGIGAATLSATTTGGNVAIEPTTIEPGKVAEVTVVPNPVAADETPVTVDFAVERDGARATASRTITVQPGADELQPEADLHLAPFLTWLSANRPELGITPETRWEAVPGAWVLIVSHYLYFSDEWELDLDWHVMVAPDDWSRICLRKRWEETAPSLAFEISSVSGRTPVHEIAPPEAVWR